MGWCGAPGAPTSVCASDMGPDCDLGRAAADECGRGAAAGGPGARGAGRTGGELARAAGAHDDGGRGLDGFWVRVCREQARWADRPNVNAGPTIEPQAEHELQLTQKLLRGAATKSIVPMPSIADDALLVLQPLVVRMGGVNHSKS